MSGPQNSYVNPEECVSDAHHVRDIYDNPVTEDTSARRRRPKCSFVCDVCKKSFTRQSTLKVQLCIHNGVHPFPCDMRKKRFTEHSHLNRHLRKHTDERPYSCYV
jgi:uncharacterized Zn-finger protein